MRRELVRFQPGDEEHVRVALYREEIFPPDTLLHLWQQMEQDNLTTLMWADGKRLPLNDFIRLFAPSEQRLLLIPVCRGTSLDCVMGIMWLETIVPPHANAHFLFFRRYWGHWPLVAIKKGIEIVFQLPLGLELLVCQANSENRLALALWKKLGVEIVGEVPGWYRHGEARHPVTFGYLQKEQWVSSCSGEQAATTGIEP